MLYILGVYHLSCYEYIGQLGMPRSMLTQNLLGSLILLVYDARHLGVNVLCPLLAIRLGESVILTR